MRRRELFATLLSGLVAACGASPPVAPVARGPARTRREARERLARLAQSYEKLMSEHGAHEYGRYAGTLSEGPAAEASMRALRKAEQEIFLEAEETLKRFGTGIVSPRRTELWQRGALGLKMLADPRSAELSDRLEAVINGHQFVLDGTPVPRSKLIEMRRSEDRAVRRRTRQLEYELHRKAAPVAKELLVRRRDLTRELGQPSFWTAMLEVRGANPAATEQILGDLERRSARAFFAGLAGAGTQRLFGRRMLMPWDLEFVMQRVAPAPDALFPVERALPTAFAIYRAFGVDLEQKKLALSLRDFAFGGQTIAVRVPDDVRLVVRKSPGMRFFAVLIHELGHAFAVLATQTAEPLYKGYEWVPGLLDPAWAEGIAETFSRLLDHPEVLQRFLGLSPGDAAAVVRARRLESLAAIRRGLVSVRFERAALEQPDGDLDKLSLDVERRFSGLLVPRDTEPTWATSPFLATYPVYIQSYTLAACVAAQIHAALKARFGPDWISPRAGNFVIEQMLADGSRSTLREKMIRGTGAPLGANPLLKFLLAAE